MNPMPIGFVSGCTSPVTDVQRVTFSAISEALARIKEGTKDGHGWIPAEIPKGPRKAEFVKSVSFLALDIEAEAVPVKDENGQPMLDKHGDQIKRVIGPEPPELPDLMAELDQRGWQAQACTSYSHCGAILPEGVRHPRYRITFNLSRSLQPAELRPLGLHVAQLLGIADCVDRACLDPARLFYFARAPQERLHLFQHGRSQGEPLPVDQLLEQAARQEQASKHAAGAHESQGGKVIDQFNAAHDIGQILEKFGYRKARGNRWLRPDSTSGMPGIVLLPDSQPQRIYAHGNDPLFSDGKAHDAFDCWSTLEGLDMKSAVRRAAELLGVVHAPGQKSKSAPGSDSERPEGTSAPADLPDPTPLPKLPPVPEFPLEILPNKLQAWVADAADRARFRPDFAAVAGMCALGSVIGRKLGIRLKQSDDWTEYANVWGADIGPPSAMKSPAMAAAMRPFKALQHKADEEHAAAMADYESLASVFKLRQDAKKAADRKALAKNPKAVIDPEGMPEPEVPVARTYWTTDATGAKLGELLAENPDGLLIERDELSGLLTWLEDERNSDARSLYLSGWSGREGARINRIGRGLTNLPRFALSVVGGIQPGPLTRYVRGAFAGDKADGLLQRFQLIVWPDQAHFDYVDRYPDPQAKQQAADLFAYADTFDAEQIGTPDDFGDSPYVRLSEDAQALFIEWYTDFMQHRRNIEGTGENAALSAHFGKYPGLVGKLALILHVADDPGAREVSAETLVKALAWIQYLTPHAHRVYHSVQHPETGAAELLLARLKNGELPERGFSARDIYRKHWHGLGEHDAVKRACRLLFDYGWLIELQQENGQYGRPSDPVYAVSPRVEVKR